MLLDNQKQKSLLKTLEKEQQQDVENKDDVEKQELQKQSTEHYQSWLLNTQKIPCMLLCCY
jgi:ribosomal protein S20